MLTLGSRRLGQMNGAMSRLKAVKQRRPVRSPYLYRGVLDVELEAKKSPPLPARVPNQLVVFESYKWKTQASDVNGGKLPSGHAGIEIRPGRSIHRCHTDHRIVSIVDPENVSPEILQWVARVPGKLPY